MVISPRGVGCCCGGGGVDDGRCSSRHSKSALEVVDLSSYDVCIELDVVRCAFLTPTSLLLSLRGGEVYALRLHLAGGGGGGGGGGCAPDRVVGQSLRPIGRASPCSVLAVSAGRKDVDIGGGGGGGWGDDGAEVSARSSTGLVFMGSRVGDSLLVKYGIESAGTRPGARGERAVKREPKKEQKEEAVLGRGKGTGSGAGRETVAPLKTGAAAVAEKSGEGRREAVDGGAAGGAADVVAGKDAPAAASPRAMEPGDEEVGGRGEDTVERGGGVAEGLMAAKVEIRADGAEMASLVDGVGSRRRDGGGDGSGGGGDDDVAAIAEPVVVAPPRPAADLTEGEGESGDAGEQPRLGREAMDVDDDSLEGGVRSKRGRDQLSPEPAGAGVEAAGDESGGEGGEEKEVEENEGEGKGSEGKEGDGKGGGEKESGEKEEGEEDSQGTAAAAADDGDQPKKKARLSKEASAKNGVGDAAGDGEGQAGARDIGTEPKKRKVEGLTAPPGRVVDDPLDGREGAVPKNASPAAADAADAADADADAAAADAAADAAAEVEEAATIEANRETVAPANAAPLEALSRKEREMIEEEEQLYGARLGPSPEGKVVVGRNLARLGPLGGGRTIEAVGFRLKVGDLENHLCESAGVDEASTHPWQW